MSTQKGQGRVQQLTRHPRPRVPDRQQTPPRARHELTTPHARQLPQVTATEPAAGARGLR